MATCEVLDMLITLIWVIISQRMYISKHPIVQLRDKNVAICQLHLNNVERISSLEENNFNK
jgi:hypothetical protein